MDMPEDRDDRAAAKHEDEGTEAYHRDEGTEPEHGEEGAEPGQKDDGAVSKTSTLETVAAYVLTAIAWLVPWLIVVGIALLVWYFFIRRHIDESINTLFGN